MTTFCGLCGDGMKATSVKMLGTVSADNIDMIPALNAARSNPTEQVALAIKTPNVPLEVTLGKGTQLS